ncbi:MAG: DUF885 domain-containing protein [Woeseiaceae bacterium]|nr:DUF885 domain-containing protein [Woeseiaceae bacterium]
MLTVSRVTTVLLFACTGFIIGCSSERDDAGQEIPAAPGDAITAAADDFYRWSLETSPEQAYFAGIDIDRHDGLSDNSPAALAAVHAYEDELLAAVEAVDVSQLRGTPEWITAAFLKQELTSRRALRVCRQELWNVNQMGGWHSGYAQLAQLQPVDTLAEREDALIRWSKFAAFVDQETANLEAGLESGYSAPRSVVQRVIEQIDGLLALPIDESPFMSPAARADDADFGQALRDTVEGQIIPAVQRHREFLREVYLPAAREALSVTANPDGEACYEASIRRYTTLDRSGRDVFELGSSVVAANRDTVIELGSELYGIEDFAEIIVAAKADPADHFNDADELLEFSRDMVARAEAEMPNWVGTMPTQAVEVVPFEPHEEGTGRSAHYRPGNEERPGEYRIPLHDAEGQSRGNAEAVAFHEAWPGHHLQIATTQAVEGLHPITRIIWFSGPGEGWARYSEALAEEMGQYSTTTGPILRRAWPARGMVVDPGIHLLGWTREQAKEFMLESGRFPASQGDAMVDRIAILPGQLTAYDSGGLEILALRREAEAELGEDFDIREFHDRVLEVGTIPLAALREHIEFWIAEERSESIE